MKIETDVPMWKQLCNAPKQKELNWFQKWLQSPFTCKLNFHYYEEDGNTTYICDLDECGYYIPYRFTGKNYKCINCGKSIVRGQFTMV